MLCDRTGVAKEQQMAEAVRSYAGPSCHTCCDLRPNRPFPLADGTWEDYSAQAGSLKTTLTIGALFVFSVQKAAGGGCKTCALLLEAIETIERKSIDEIEVTDEAISVYGKLGEPLAIEYDIVGGVHMAIELFRVAEPPNSGPAQRRPPSYARTHGSESSGKVWPRSGTSSEREDCIGPGTFVNQTMTPDIAARYARVSLEACQRNHEDCRRAMKPELPTRVVYVGSKDGSVRLYQTKPGEREDYVALSYCWGKSQPLTTTRENVQMMINGISWDQVPRTLREAMEFTRALGVPYIWIDALCIVQNDPQDWEIEAARMKTIYEHALLTLSATSSPDVSIGCFLPRKKPAHSLSMAGVFVRISCTTTHSSLFKYAQDGNGIDFAPYAAMSRGWIFQERLLSPRILYAAYDELLWECRACITCECSPVDRYRGPGVNAVTEYKKHEWERQHFGQEYGDDHASAAAGIVRMWLDLLAAYSHREFGYYSDRLVALSGIAQKFQNLDRLGEYHAGIWQFSMVTQLAWARWPGQRIRESARVGGPSWSWAAINQPVIFAEIYRPSMIRTQFHVRDCRSQLKTSDPTGAVLGGRLTVEAPTVVGTLVTGPNRMALLESYYDTYKGLVHKDMLEVYVKVNDVTLLMTADVCQWAKGSETRRQMQREEILRIGEEVVIAELFETIEGREHEADGVYRIWRCPWLVLRKLSGKQAYRRIGLIDFSDRSDFKKEEQDRELLRPFEERRTLVIV